MMIDRRRVPWEEGVRAIHMRRAKAVVLSRCERRTLTRWAADEDDPLLATKARAILLAAEGETNAAISRVLGRRVNTVRVWRTRFLELRLAGLASHGRAGATRALEVGRREKSKGRFSRRVRASFKHLQES
jgi:transposase-like protein